MKFLLDIFKKSQKGDAFRAPDSVVEYNDGIAKLNSLGANQYDQLTTQKVNKISKDSSVLEPTTDSNTIVPGIR